MSESGLVIPYSEEIVRYLQQRSLPCPLLHPYNRPPLWSDVAAAIQSMRLPATFNQADDAIIIDGEVAIDGQVSAHDHLRIRVTETYCAMPIAYLSFQIIHRLSQDCGQLCFCPNSGASIIIISPDSPIAVLYNAWVYAYNLPDEMDENFYTTVYGSIP